MLGKVVVAGLAWMRMMGADSVAYHEHTVAGRGDDPVAGALEYYGSRGETPMVWGGVGRLDLGLDGEVDLADWRALFGPGGARDPLTGDRLVGCRRPGMELVVSPHKSVAELGVIGRAEDMHVIADAERDATLGYLDRLVGEAGGRRGRSGTRAPTGGLIWATSRHATTRAGDPQVHDHVLVANVVSMRDARGGWKALDTAFLRDHLHAATAVGRMAAAAKAVELGYGLEPDSGPSGRLGGWAIAGIPKEACGVHSTRAAQIDRAVGPDGSYRARAVAARATRDRKDRDTVEDLVGRWREELTQAGYPPVELDGRVRDAGLEYRLPGLEVLDRLAGELLGPGGRLAQNKTFTRGDVIIAAAPLLHGLPVSCLYDAVARVIDHDLAVPLPEVAGAAEPVWAAVSVLADEERIAELAERLTAPTASKVNAEVAAGAVSRFEAAQGLSLTDAQRAVAVGLVSSDRQLDVVIGVAGSGKTTTLAAVRAGLEEADFEVIGAATSGQAARTLAAGAGIDSRTVASLSWRLEHGQARLTDRHVLILDEAGMTTDADMGRLLTAVDRAGARMVVVGDYHQLDAVGPGGALEAVAARHPDAVHALTDNLRQVDPAERATLDQLRAGSVDAAVGWYGRHGRIHPAATRARAVYDMVDAWAADVAAGKESLLLAYRRDNVAALNHTARQAWRALGRLDGPELHAGDGRVFQAGDRIITLAPGPDGAWTTSQRATISVVDPDQRTLRAVTPEGNELHISGDYLGADRIGYGYAITVHRSQGATVDSAHVLADGGGRELGYVAMSRARGESHVHAIAASREQAADRLAWEWQHSRRQTWTPQVVVDPSELADLRRQRYQLRDSIPPDVRHQLEHARVEHDRYRRDLDDLYAGKGRWAGHPAGQAAAGHHDARRVHDRAREHADDPGLGWWARRKAGQELAVATVALEQAASRWQRDGGPVAANYQTRLDHLDREITRLEASQGQRLEFLDRHPELPGRIAELGVTIRELEAHLREQRRHQLEHDPHLADSLWPGRHHSISQEPDLGMSL